MAAWAASLACENQVEAKRDRKKCGTPIPVRSDPDDQTNQVSQAKNNFSPWRAIKELKGPLDFGDARRVLETSRSCVKAGSQPVQTGSVAAPTMN